MTPSSAITALTQLKQQCKEREVTAPVALLDLDAFEHNARLLFDHFSTVNSPRMRIATKSLRVGALIKGLLDRDPQRKVIAGVMCFRVGEAVHLASRWGADDLLIAYPIASRSEAIELTKLQSALSKRGGSASIVVDSRAQVDLLSNEASTAQVELALIVDLNLAYRPIGSSEFQLGARRSPLAAAEPVVELARYIADRPWLRLHGLMGYEAHHAAIGDRPHERLFKRISTRAIERLRREVGSGLAQAGFGDLAVLNGGGSGSYLTTSKSSWINEVAIGSAFYKTALFDTHRQLRQFRPSLFFALQTVRTPGRGWATLFGGGYYASGGGSAPVIAAPDGLKVTASEGFGEVQTPVRDRRVELQFGDLVLARPAKAGEPLERFNEIYPWQNGELGEPLKTYRGEGENFG